MALDVVQCQQQMKQYKDHKHKAQSSGFQPGSWVRVKRLLREHKLSTVLSMVFQVLGRVGCRYLLDEQWAEVAFKSVGWSTARSGLERASRRFSRIAVFGSRTSWSEEEQAPRNKE